jgi:hypothetical protein
LYLKLLYNTLKGYSKKSITKQSQIPRYLTGCYDGMPSFQLKTKTVYFWRPFYLFTLLSTRLCIFLFYTLNLGNNNRTEKNFPSMYVRALKIYYYPTSCHLGGVGVKVSYKTFFKVYRREEKKKNCYTYILNVSFYMTNKVKTAFLPE